jgi:hypothetical protein
VVRATVRVAFPDLPRSSERRLTEIEFYQRLSEHIPEEAAKLIAERNAGSRLDAKIDALAAQIGTLATKVEAEKLRSSFFRWALAFFVPLWVGTYATLVAIVQRASP